MSLRGRLAATAGIALLGVLGPVAAAHAAFGLSEFEVEYEKAGGAPATQAGSHPSAVTTTLHLNTEEGNPGEPEGELRDLEVTLPAGFAGAPSTVPTCRRSDFLDLEPIHEAPNCPDETVVGTVIAEVVQPGGDYPRGLYNLVPPPGAVAEFGFRIAKTPPVTVTFYLEQGHPYRVIAKSTNTPQAVRIFGAQLTVWGVPADPVHDEERGGCAFPTSGDDKCPSSAPRVAFITLPRSCSGPLLSSFSARSWQDAADSGSSASALETDGCGDLGFDPQVDAGPTSTVAATPTGLDFDLAVDDAGLFDPDGRAASDIEKAVVTLPQGLQANPAAASGLVGCGSADFAAERLDPAGGCPEASKLGTVEAESPLLAGTVFKGSVYLARQGDNPFGSLLALYLVIREPRLGVLVKLAGKIEADPVTGQLTTRFERLPQLPLSSVRLRLAGGEVAPLVTPSSCGAYSIESKLFPYANPTAPLTRTASFAIESGPGGAACGPQPHDPRLETGTVDPTAARFSPFVFRLFRRDGAQRISRISAALPEGLIGRLAGTPYCPEGGISQAEGRSGEQQGAVEVAAPSCPPDSQVGTVLVEAGSGPRPLPVAGRVYLAGPYRGAPLSLIVITPAIAGPFDLGVVAVRTALRVDPRTTQVSAVSDPIPQLLHGLPLDLRTVSLYLDKPSFMLNPSSCEPKRIEAAIASTADQIVSLGSHFQAADCGALGFRPRLSLRLSGGTKRGSHPALRAEYRSRPGDANLDRLVVRLPHSVFLEQSHIRTICTRVQYAASTCPRGSVYGRVVARTPLLDQPLRGPVYLRSSDHALPDLVMALRGQVEAEVVARIDSLRGGLRASIEDAPDVPVSKVVLSMPGGRKSLLVNSTGLCRRRHRANAALVAQSGMRTSMRPVLRSRCAATDGKGDR